MKKVLLLLAVVVFFAFTLYGQNKNSYSLQEAMDYGVKNSYNVKTAAIDYEIAKKKVKEIITIGLPQVNGEVDYNDFTQVPVMLLPGEFIMGHAGKGQYFPLKFQQKYNFTPKITATQLLFDGSYIVGVQASKMYQQLSEQGIKKSEIEVRSAIAQSYYLILVANENKKIIQTTLENIDKILNETVQIQKNGFMEETDVDQLKLMKSNLTNTLNKIIRQEQVAQVLLKFQMGINVDDPISLSDSLSSLILKNGDESVLNKELDIKNIIDYKMLLTTENLKNLNLRKEKFGYLPSLIAIFTYQKTGQNNNFSDLGKVFYPSTMWGLTLKIPILDCGTKHFKIAQAKLDIEKTKIQEKQVEQGLKLDLITAKSNFSSALDNYRKESDNRELAKKIYNNTIIKYKNGVASSLELTQVHNQYLTSEGNYYNAIFEVLNTRIKLDKALGNF
jgi:outer membrane protein TolC